MEQKLKKMFHNFHLIDCFSILYKKSFFASVLQLQAEENFLTGFTMNCMICFQLQLE